MTGFKAPIRLFLTVTATASVTTLVLALGFLTYLDRVYTVDKCYVRICPEERAVVLGEPPVSTKLYMLGPYMRYLLVVTSESSEEWCMYYVDVINHEMGVPDYSVYRPFGKGALVSWLAIEGFECDTTIAATWEWRNHDLHIRVKGYADDAGDSSALSLDDSETATVANEISPQGEAPEMLRLIYGREIVLKPFESRPEGERSSQVSMDR